MKIKELIQLLNQYDPEEIVYIIGGSGGGFPLTKESIGMTHRVVCKYNVCNDVSCFGIYGE